MDLPARMAKMAGRFARVLWADQIVLPEPFAALDRIEARTATRCGRRRLAPERIVRHPDNPRLIKVGLEGDVVRDAPSAAETMARLAGQRGKNSLGSKLRRYLLTPDPYIAARIVGFLAGRWRARHAPPFGAQSSCGDKRWALVPGVNFWQGDDGAWRCTDHGAIYETLLTSHAVRYPSQVGSDLYTNSCAAYLFRLQSERTGEADWQEALKASRQYITNLALAPHSRQRLESDHREFDFGPLWLALGPEAAAPWAGWVNYDPVNVYGLRYFNEALVAPLGRDRAARRRRAVILSTLERNQTRQGLLQDNFSGNAVDSTDLTYHQYALAMLCLGNARINEARADKIIVRALAYSIDQMLETGEATYYGRGANNIYHLASLAAALSYGAGNLGLDSCRAPLDRALARLEAFQDADGQWPTAMNRADPGLMLGWHGSNRQYGALSAFLLAEGAALLAAGKPPADSVSVSPASPALPAFPTSPTRVRHCVLRGGGVELALTSGGGAIPWSQGLHCSGFAGMTALVIEGRNLLLTNDLLVPWGEAPVLVADLQNQTPLDRRRLIREGATAHLEIAGPTVRGRFTYAPETGGFRVTARGAARTAGHALALVGRCRIVQAQPNAVTLVSDAGYSVTVRVGTRMEATLTPVPVNPQGPGTLVRFRLVAPAECPAVVDFDYRFAAHTPA